MKNWKQALLASASGVVLTGSALAADLPAKAPMAAPAAIPYVNWTGGYIGILLGGGSSHSACTVDGQSDGSGCQQWNTFGSHQANSLGAVAGVELGYDWQNRYFVYGVVGDWTWTNMRRTITGGSGSQSYEAKVNWLASFRGRAGIAIDSTLLYLTGGVALGGIKDRINYYWTPGGTLEQDNVKVGWVAGAGIEHRFTPNWSLKFEYLHYEFADTTLEGTDPSGDPARLRFSHSIDVGRVGAAYRF
jgi:outer membrane immunogenic protein